VFPRTPLVVFAPSVLSNARRRPCSPSLLRANAHPINPLSTVSLPPICKSNTPALDSAIEPNPRLRGRICAEFTHQASLETNDAAWA